MSNGNLLGNFADINNSGLMFRNRIINGDMRIDQRGNGTEIVNDTLSYKYGVDRFATFNSVTTNSLSLQRISITDIPSFNFATRIKVKIQQTPPSSSEFGFGQKIEGFNMDDLFWGTSSAKSVTLSFWARASTVINNVTCGMVQAIGGGQSYLTKINLTTSFQKYIINIPGPTTNTTFGTQNSYHSQFWMSFGAHSAYTSSSENIWAIGPSSKLTGSTDIISLPVNTYVDITGIQLESGQQTTTFERRPFGIELLLCQRYYEIGSCRKHICIVTGANNVWDGYAVTQPVYFKIQKRTNSVIFVTKNFQGLLSNNNGSYTAPLGNYGGPGGVVADAFGVELSGNWSWYNNAGGNVNNIVACRFDWTADAEL